ncbi:MAG TPA: Crp/Fnr family transcriptional regulator [Anaerolineae bacterium]|nr:Crp/Fnr family transcriptional regulator [Anaerolineae bacterium]
MFGSSPEDVLSKRLAFLYEIPLFNTLKAEDIAALANEFRVRDYRPGDTIFHQGDQSRELYLVMKGKVRVFLLSPAGDETTIVILARRHLLGEFAIMDGQPRSATAKAISACTLLEISQAKFWNHLEHTPGLALAMCKQLVSKARWTCMYAETIAQLDAAGRLLHLLLLYNDEFGQIEEAGRRSVLDLGLNQTARASLVGARRGWINSILQDWRKRGLIELEAGKITFLDLPRIHQERDSRIAAHFPE